MLVIIVVTAATLLAAFVATYQKQLQSEEAFTHDQNLESLHILGLNTTVGSGNYSGFGFTLASKYVNPSVVLNITINGQPLKFFNWSDTTGTDKGKFRGGPLNLSAFEEVYISLDLDPATPEFSFFVPNGAPQPNEYLIFNVYTLLQNDFTQVFLPPTPLPVVSEINPSGNNPLTLLDGSTSFQPGSNASIVSWAWTITRGDLVSRAANISTPTGGDVSGPITGNGSANFTVPQGFAYGPGNSVAFVAGEPTTSVGTCSLSDVVMTPSAERETGTTLTVNYTYHAVAGGGGCSSAVQTDITAGGVILNPMPLPLNASGEEFEISPALPALGSAQIPYLVTLTVTNSVGLQGTAAVSYTPLP